MGDVRREALDRAYRLTIFAADVDGRRLEIRVGCRHPELDAILAVKQAASWAFITAWNPSSRPSTAEDNDRQQQALLCDLRTLPVFAYRGRGEPASDEWMPEESALVIGLTESEALRLGYAYGQNAIVVGITGGPARLVWCR